MSKKATIVLAIVVAALAGYIALFERDSLTSKELDARKDKVLRTFVREKVDRLELTLRGQKVVLERTQAKVGEGWNDWALVAPARVAADQQAVDHLLGELEWLSARRMLVNITAEDKQSFGLHEPAFQVRYRVAKDEHVLRVGGADVHGESHYASLDDENDAYLVPKTILETLDREPSHFRSKQFLGDITSAWAQRVELGTGAQKQLLQKEAGTWWYTSGLKTLADQRRVSALVEALDTLRAERYVEGSAKAAALEALAHGSYVDLRVMPDQHREDKAPERFLLRFAGPCAGHTGERYAQAGEQGDPVCVAADALEPIDAHEDELRLTRLFGEDPSEIEVLTLKSAAGTQVLRRAGERWLMDKGAAPDRESVEAWLADLVTYRAGTPAPLTTLREDGSLTLLLVNSKQVVCHFHFDEQAQRVLVWRDGESVQWSHQWALAERLRPLEMRFSTLEPWASKQPSQVLAVDARAGTLHRSLTLRDGTWHADKGGALSTQDAARVRELVRDLLKLRARAIVAEQARPAHGLDKPRAELTLRLAVEAVPLKLALGAATPRGSYARVGELIVELGPEVEPALVALAGGTPSAPDAGADAADESEEQEPSDHVHEGEHSHEHLH